MKLKWIILFCSLSLISMAAKTKKAVFIIVDGIPGGLYRCMGRLRDHPDKGGKRSYITGCGDADELVFMGQPIVRRNETVLRNCSGCCGETDGCPGVIICKFCITFTLFYRYYLSEFTLYLLRNGFDRCCK